VKSTLFSALFLSAAVCAFAQAPTTADVIYMHGQILTGSFLRLEDLGTGPAGPPFMSWLAVKGGSIVAIGVDDRVMTKFKGPATKVIDLNGAFAMPGFNDAHTHIASAGQQKLSVDLDHVTSLAAMQEKVKAAAEKAKPGAWLQGGGWDHTVWPGKALPTKEDMDAVTAGHPAFFYRTDGHIAIANSAALAAAGITAATKDPMGGKIDRDAKGEPTGIIREDPAMQLVSKVIPPPTREERIEALNVAMQDAIAHGVTTVQDFSDWEDFLALEQLEREGKLHLRVSEWLAFNTPVDVLQRERAAHPETDRMLHTTMLKGFMDGSLGSRTAAMNAPYSDDPGNSGIPRYDEKKLDAMAIERAQAGFQLGFHAIGDRANDIALTAFEKAQKARMEKMKKILPELEASTHAHIEVTDSSRYRIEHAQVVSPGDFERFAKLHVIASMQPSHLLTDMNWAEARLGPERVKYSYAWKSFLDHGVVLAFGTDYPVESVSPFRGLYAAITRQNEAGTKTYQPQEKISLNEAIYAYTQASAYAENAEKFKGRLEPGFVADFVVLDRDLTKATPQELLKTKVLRTVMNGETVYSAGSE
jgi:predicted amidohydrolase YtcJ